MFIFLTLVNSTEEGHSCRPPYGARFFVISQQLILTRWKPLMEPLVDLWMAAIESGSGIEEQWKMDTCYGILRPLWRSVWQLQGRRLLFGRAAWGDFYRKTETEGIQGREFSIREGVEGCVWDSRGGVFDRKYRWELEGKSKPEVWTFLGCKSEGRG